MDLWSVKANWALGAGAAHTVMYGRGSSRRKVYAFYWSPDGSEKDALRARIVVLGMRILEMGGKP